MIGVNLLNLQNINKNKIKSVGKDFIVTGLQVMEKCKTDNPWRHLIKSLPFTTDNKIIREFQVMHLWSTFHL